MGKLAERYQDPARSAVYRVASAEIPRRAAREAGASLTEVPAAEAEAGAVRVRRSLAERDRRPHVLLLGDVAELARSPARYATLVQRLQDLAQACKSAGLPFFAVMVDPDAALELPALYKEAARTGAG